MFSTTEDDVVVKDPALVGFNVNATPWGPSAIGSDKSGGDASLNKNNPLSSGASDGWNNGDNFHLPSEFTTPSVSVESAFTMDPFGGSSLKPDAAPSQESTTLDPKVKQFLANINLSKYAETFAENEIDWDALLILEKDDLIGLGIDKTGPLLKFKRASEEAQKKQNMAKQAKEENDGMNHLGALWSDFSGIGSAFDPNPQSKSNTPW